MYLEEQNLEVIRTIFGKKINGTFIMKIPKYNKNTRKNSNWKFHGLI